MDIASEIRGTLGRHKMSYAQLAELSGLSESTIRRKIEKEESPLNLVQIEKIASAFGLTSWDLARRAEEYDTRQGGDAA